MFQKLKYCLCRISFCLFYINEYDIIRLWLLSIMCKHINAAAGKAGVSFNQYVYNQVINP